VSYDMIIQVASVIIDGGILAFFPFAGYFDDGLGVVIFKVYE
jgi:hypothetical protein